MSTDSPPMEASSSTASSDDPMRAIGHRLLLTLGPILIALIIAGLILVAIGVNPLEYYGYVLKRGLLSPTGVQQTLTRMAPMLFIAAGLIVAFRAGIWNLGVDGQFLLGAVASAASAPLLAEVMPSWAALIIAFSISAIVAMVWSLLPALLKAYHGVNEIITTLMMTFLGVSLANVMVKLVFLDPAILILEILNYFEGSQAGKFLNLWPCETIGTTYRLIARLLCEPA